MILFYQWNAFMQRGMENALKRLNIEYEVYYDCARDWDSDNEFADRFRKRITAGIYDVVISVNFMPVISDICNDCSVKYVSWVYDSPLHIRRLDTLKNKCNYIFFFDRAQADYYLADGVTGARHLALAADPDVFAGVNTGTYDCDVAFLGQLYKSEYQDLCRGLSLYSRGYLEGIIAAQSQINGGYIIDEMLTADTLGLVNADFLKASKGRFSVTGRELSYTLSKETTGRQRYTALALLSDRCRVNVYSNDMDGRLEKASFCGYADYYDKMPAVFRSSKINLNISLCTIQTGIPLRVLDIMACGGFVLTNMQPELMEYFIPGEDVAVYEDMKDMIAKVQFYLEHEELRKRIAHNGYLKVCEMFRFDDRIKYMLEIADEK